MSASKVQTAGPLSRWHQLAVATGLSLLGVAATPKAWSQQAQPGMPGLVVTMPQSAPQGAPPPAMPGIVVSAPPAAPAQQPPAMPGLVVTPSARPPQQPPAATPPEAKAKPKPKPAARKLAGPDPDASGKAPQGIAALVNDEPVTAFEVERLARFMALSANIGDRARANMKAIAEDPKTNERLKEILQETIKANPGKTREEIIAAFEERKKQFVLSLQKRAVDSARSSSIPPLRKKALEELIEERLKFQEAKRLNVTIASDEVEKSFKSIAERNKTSVAEFAANIRAQGADPDIIKSRLKVQLTWREVIRKRFGHTISVSNKEVDQLIQNSKTGEEQTELQLQRVTITSPGKLDQKLMAQRLGAAEALRSKFSGCKSTQSLVKDADTKFEDLGFRKASTLTEPTRSLVINARDGEMVPANLTAAGVELYAVCGRRTVKVDEQKRQQAESELQMKEFERIAQRHLQDLRKDALIEMR